MTSDHMIRASDRDRDVVVDTLRDAYTAGRLTLEEFQERTSAAYVSRTWGELRGLTGDLPVQPVLGSDLPGHEQQVTPQQRIVPPPPPPVPPRQAPVRPGNRSPWPPVLPFVAIWILFALGTRSSDGALAGLIIVMALLLFTSIARRR